MNNKINSKLKPTVVALRNTIYSAAILPIAAYATIVVPPGNPEYVQYTSTGITPPPQGVTGQNGQDGGAASDYSVELQSPVQTISGGGTSPALVYLSSTGGSGSGGGASEADLNHNGPLGGDGAVGGDLSAIFDAPVSSSPVTDLQNGLYPAVYLNSQGGSGGYGADQLSDQGNGGIGGLGADGGTLLFTVAGNPSYPSALNFISGDTAAVWLTSTGGNGGSSGASKSEGGSSEVTGRAGNNAGDGGGITVNTAGYIDGTNGSGIVALSQGGDGGTGGKASGSGAAVTGANGGYAGNGGNINIIVSGGNVTANSSATPQTGESQQFDSSTNPELKIMLDTTVTGAGIMATSQGGVGGSAGMINGFVTHGANGAKGGKGGQVSISLEGSSVDALGNTVLSTVGYNTFGAMALSIGGDGGNGNSGNGVFFSSGGNGGSGGDAGEAIIKVSNDTSVPYAFISTSGDHSDALVAMSVGGGGGVSGNLSDNTGAEAFSAYIGAVGGVGGDGNDALISNGYYDNPPSDGSQAAFHPGDVITTTGTASRGMIAQSVGGGGGLGGDAINTAIGASIAIGGFGGAGGDGGLARVANFGLISTKGLHSDGILAQSVGGGGGIGGGAMSRDISAQIGVSLAIGGNGGEGGNADEADAYNLGQIQTYGGNAHAIFAQAVGGGGGTGGTSMAENYTTSMPDEPSLTVTTSIGGKGGVGGDGGVVQVVNDGLLQTQGQDAYGVFAESVGGGGGYGGDASSTSMAYQQSKFTIGTTIGGDGAAGGKGGSVSVWNSGLIDTSGAKSIGVFAQSVGGGGGAGGSGTADQGGVYQAGGYSLQLTTTIGGRGGAAGNGGDVVVNNYINSTTGDPGNYSNTELFSNRDLTGIGAILTAGDMAAGIQAQSVGGGGGNGGDSTGKGSNGQINANVAIGGAGGAAGDGGNVTVHNGTGVIVTYGAQSYGIIAQSVGGGGGTGGNATTGSGDDPEYLYPKQVTSIIANKDGVDPSSFTPVTDYLWDWKDNIKGAWDDKNRLEELAQINALNSVPSKPNYLGVKATDLTVDVGAGFGGNGGATGKG
ncbi:hypothetical protein J1782_00365, partial [Rahnella sp. BCC 1045]|uniref:hypothetical protein n=1 Tax=Rahnella sp. BCC 1045 TaxID=2816251 RepID=UPI001C26B567